MSALLAALYCLCLIFLAAFALFVLTRNSHARLNRYFAWLACALLGWVASLFVFDTQPPGETLLWLGRFNFACVAVAVTLGALFVGEVARPTRHGENTPSRRGWLWAETAAVSALCFTPLIDRQELVRAGQHVTLYGPWFPLYVLHVLALLAASLLTAFRPRAGLPPEMRSQLSLSGSGILATAGVGLVTNVVLPYGFGDFRFIHVGTLSTALFLAAVGYAVFAHHLFNIRVIVRAAFVYAGLIALGLELYQLAVTFLAHLLPFGDATERGFAATALALVVNAFTQQPVRRWLGRLMDRSLSSLHPRRRRDQARAGMA